MSNKYKEPRSVYDRKRYYANHEVNKAKGRAQAAKSYRANPEKYRERAKMWRLANPEKAPTQSSRRHASILQTCSRCGHGITC